MGPHGVVFTPSDWQGEELASAADENFVAHVSFVQRRAKGMRVVDERGLVLVDSGLPCDTFNFVCRARLESEGALARAREAIDSFDAVGRPFSWWLGPADRPRELGTLLVEAGLERAETELAMAADLRVLGEGELSPGGVDVRRVRTPTELRHFAEINAANWDPPDRFVMEFYRIAEPALLSGESALRLYVGYLAGVPVASSELTVGGGVVGLYNIATREAYRRRGFGTAMTLRPLLDARADGFTTAILQAARDGVGVYTRVGFRPFGDITEYKPPSRPLRERSK